MAEFRCGQCGRVFYTEEALQQHTAAKHQPEEVKEKKHGRIKTAHIIGIVVIILIGVGVYFAATSTPPSFTPAAAEHLHFRGSADAPVEMTEFSDFQCPFCARFFRNTLPEIESTYIETGQVKLVYKHFPLPSHSNAPKAAEAAECAADIGGEEKFWEYHDRLFENNNLLSTGNLKRFAGEIGLNQTAFNACLESGAMRPRVLEDQQEGRNRGVTGTPAFFINGQLVSGAQPFSVFQGVIDRFQS